jgi:hypothetical protein
MIYMARKRVVPLKRFVIKYTAFAVVEAKNPREAFELADEAMTDLVENDELALDDIFAVELTNDKVHIIAECDDDGDPDESEDEDSEEDDSGDDEEDDSEEDEP